jgi:hypothetical protein
MYFLKSTPVSQVLVAHDCNPSYLGGRDQEDHSLKPDTLSQKYPTQTRAGSSGKVPGWQP